MCPVGESVGGSGARAVSRKTPIYFILFAVKLKLLQKLFVGTFSGQKNFAIVSQAVKRKKHHCTKVFCEQKKTLPLTEWMNFV